jgi:hypothetical protein
MRLLDVVNNNTLILAIVVEICASFLAFTNKISADDWMKVTLVILSYTGGLYVGRFRVEQSKAQSS